MTVRYGVLTALVVLAAGWAAWRVEDRTRETAFQAPGLVAVVHEEEGGVARDLSQVDGRIRAQARLAMELRWLVDPVELVVEEPQGWVELALGDPDKPSAALQLSPDAARLHVRQADGGMKGWRMDRPAGNRFALVFDGTAYEARVGGQLLEQPVPGPAPEGPARIGLRPQASLRSVSCRTAEGDERLIRGPQPESATERTAWACLTALLGMWALRSWWFARTAASGDDRSAGRAGLATWVLAVLVVGVLVQGLAGALRAHNEGRLTVAPEPCVQEPLVAGEDVTLQPGHPLDLNARKDGDFVLTAQVRLAPDTVLDILVRGEPVERDRGILATLSTDPAMLVGLSRNLGTSLRTEHASGRRAVLTPDTSVDLRIVCSDADTTLFLDGDEVLTTRDYDLRTGRTAFLVLAGSVTVSRLDIHPSGQPRALDGALRRWQWMSGGAVVLGLALMLAWLGGRVSAVLWAWPLAAAVAPAAPEGMLVPCAIAAGLLLLFTPGRGRRLLGWVLGAVPLTAALWAATEEAPVLTPTLLNDMRPTEVWGDPIPRAYAWARHPLVRRFNRYVRGQRFRDEVVPLAKEPGVTRVFTLGSSSTFGYGVSAESAFAKQLEQQLREQGHAVEVFNAGVPGSTAARLALNLEGQLLPFAPDVVIVDLSFNDHIQGAIFDENAHYDAMTTGGIGWPGYVMGLLDGRQRAKSWGQYFSAARDGGEIDPELLERHALGPARRFGDELRRMVLAARAAGATVVLVQEPPDPAAGNTMIGPFHDAMAAVAQELDVVLVDPSPALEPGGDELYLDAVHLTAEGHRRMAAAMASALTDAGLVR